MTMNTLYSVQAARGLAAFFVVAFHMLSIEVKYVEPKLLPPVFYFGQIGVDIFFVISGFVMVLSTERLVANRTTIAEFLRRRLVRVYPIYWFFALLLLPVYLISPQLVNASEGHQVDLVRSFLLLPNDSLPLLAVAWSLVFELWFYLIFAIFLMFPRRMLPYLLLCWAIALLAFWLMTPALQSPTLKVLTSTYAYEFIAGCAGYFFYRGASEYLAKAAVTFGVVGLVALLGTWPNLVETPSITRACSLGIVVSLVLSGIAVIERNGRLGLLPLLKWTGDISYTVYLSHVLVLSAVGRLWLSFVPQPRSTVLVALAFWLLAISAVIAAGLFAHHFIEKPLGALLNRRSYRAAAVAQRASIPSGEIATDAPIKSNSASSL